MLTKENYQQVMLENAKKLELAIKEVEAILNGPVIPGIVADDLRYPKALGRLQGTVSGVQIALEVWSKN